MNRSTQCRSAPGVEDAELALDTNLTGAFLCSYAAYPLLKHAGRGKVINIGSVMS